MTSQRLVEQLHPIILITLQSILHNKLCLDLTHLKEVPERFERETLLSLCLALYSGDVMDTTTAVADEVLVPIETDGDRLLKTYNYKRCIIMLQPCIHTKILTYVNTFYDLPGKRRHLYLVVQKLH